MSVSSVPEVQSKLLLAFDFDHSLIDENSDLYIIKLAPGGELPEEIKNLYTDNGWTPYMGEIFKYLHRLGQTPENILKCLTEIPLTDGMKELTDFTIGCNLVDHIIISDSNSLFIEHILKEKKLFSSFCGIFTNPAKFDERGCLTIKEYHFQDWCTLSTVNLCKGHILNEFLSKQQKKGVKYENVVFVGDGFNDLCAGLRLRPQDCLMPRAGFKLNKVIEKMAVKKTPVPREELKASVIPWTSGIDILKYIQGLAFIKNRCLR